MRFITLSFAIAVFITMAAFTNTKTLVVTSTAFTNNGMIPAKYSCLGQEASPPLNVTNIPEGARSLVLIVDDPDAPVKLAVVRQATKGNKKHAKKKPVTKVANTGAAQQNTFTHWIIWNLDVDGHIPENFRNDYEGMNGVQKNGYVGMCPPAGTHHYHFKVYALDIKLNMPRTTNKAAIEKVMEGHILAWGDLVGTFDKTYR